MSILIKNISPNIVKQLKDKLPAVNLSLVVRALLAFGSQMDTNELTRIVNKQAELEAKEKG